MFRGEETMQVDVKRGDVLRRDVMEEKSLNQVVRVYSRHSRGRCAYDCGV